MRVVNAEQANYYADLGHLMAETLIMCFPLPLG
jgi:hypothetical protein